MIQIFRICSVDEYGGHIDIASFTSREEAEKQCAITQELVAELLEESPHLPFQNHTYIVTDEDVYESVEEYNAMIQA